MPMGLKHFKFKTKQFYAIELFIKIFNKNYKQINSNEVQVRHFKNSYSYL